MDSTNNQLLYSVLIPVRNTKEYIVQCLESVLQQTYQNFEIIIVDNESTDGSEKIIDEYAAKDLRIRVIHQENHGLLMSRRKAISEAKGDYFCFLDSDDIWRQDFLITVNQALCENNFDMCIIGYQEIDEKGNPGANNNVYHLENKYEGETLENLWYTIVEHPVLNNMWLKVIRRDCFSKEQDTEYQALGEINGTEGAIQTLEVLKNAKRVICIPDKQIYMYRIRKTSTIHTGALKYYEECKISHRYFENFVQETCSDTKKFYDKRLISIRFAIFGVVCNVANSKMSYGKKKQIFLSIINDDLFCFATRDIKVPKNVRECVLFALKFRAYVLVMFLASIRKTMEAIS